MKVRHSRGTMLNVTTEKAARLVASMSWHYVDSPPEKPVEALKEAPEGDDTGEAGSVAQEPSQPQIGTKPAPSIPEMRAWALKAGIPGVKDKGKLPRKVIEAYLEVHKE